jgi:ATP-dependent Lon protease
MQESARAALSYVRSRAADLGLNGDFFDKSDIHLHVPAGAQPKDGPSAGVAMATALVSLISGRPVRPDVGMTGEITLRGQVMPVGGIKEKMLAAHRFGLKTAIIPARNEADLEDIPDEVCQSMKFVFSETIDDVLAAALEPAQAAEIEEEVPSEEPVSPEVVVH